MTFELQEDASSASALVRQMVFLVAFVGAISVIGGFYLALEERFATIKFTFFGNDFSSTSIGVAMVFIGVALVGSVYVRVLRSIDRFASSGGAGGNAEVIGDGEARGGKGGNSGSFGPGGNGGNALVKGSGKATGGTGGNGG